MADKRKGTSPPSRKTREGSQTRRKSGWQKPTKPPSGDSRPPGLPPKKNK